MRQQPLMKDGMIALAGGVALLCLPSHPRAVLMAPASVGYVPPAHGLRPIPPPRTPTGAQIVLMWRFVPVAPFVVSSVRSFPVVQRSADAA